MSEARLKLTPKLSFVLVTAAAAVTFRTTFASLEVSVGDIGTGVFGRAGKLDVFAALAPVRWRK